MTTGPEVSRGEEARVTRAGRKVENRLAGPGIEQLDQPLGNRACRIPEEGPALLPPACDGAPGLDALLAGVYAAAPENVGMIFLP